MMRSSADVRRALAALLVGVVALGLTECGSSKPGASPPSGGAGGSSGASAGQGGTSGGAARGGTTASNAGEAGVPGAGGEESAGEAGVGGSSVGTGGAAGSDAGAAGSDAGAAGSDAGNSFKCVATGSLASARIETAAVLLGNGKVLIVGGLDTKAAMVLASAELYDPASRTFSSTGALSVPRAFFGMALLTGGKVLVAGGVDGSGKPLASTELYDPVAGTWSPAGNMSSARAAHTAVPLSDGRAIVYGGWSQLAGYAKNTASVGYTAAPLTTAELYDPRSNTFSATGPTGTPHAFSAGTRLGDGTVLIASGITGLGQDTAAAEVYGASGTFASAGNLPNNAAGQPFALTLNDGRGFVFMAGGFLDNSGYTAGGLGFLYDPIAGTFESAPKDLIGANAGALLPGGDLFLAGGGGAASPTAQTEIYHVASSTWEYAGNMTVARRRATLATLPSGGVLVMSGCTLSACTTTILTSAEVCGP
jgi:hypothetical protein